MLPTIVAEGRSSSGRFGLVAITNVSRSIAWAVPVLSLGAAVSLMVGVAGIVGDVGDGERRPPWLVETPGIAGDDVERIARLGLEIGRRDQPDRAVGVDRQQGGVGAGQRIGDPVAVGVAGGDLVDDRAGGAVLGDLRGRRRR